MLVRAATTTVADEQELQERALQVLAAERLHAGLAAEGLLEAVVENARAQARGEGTVDTMSLALSESERQMLAGILMHEDEPLTAELLQGALEALRHRRQLSQREGEIKRGIVDAERRNDVAALLRLKQEKLELDRKLAAGT